MTQLKASHFLIGCLWGASGVLFSCSSGGNSGIPDSDSSSDVDTDSDADTDTDVDADTDTDDDAGTDADTDTDGNSDTSTEDTDEAGDSDSGSDSDSGDNALIEFHNLMIIKRNADINGSVTSYSDPEIAALQTAFSVTWPALIAEITQGDVRMLNSTVVDDSPITSLGYADDMVEPGNVPGWETHAAPTGTYDVVFLASSREQGSMWALGGGLTVGTVVVGWISVGKRTDLGIYEDALAGWSHEYLHIIGESFFRDRLGLQYVPGVHDAEMYGYIRTMDGYDHWVAWYRDYYNRQIFHDDQYWGLGSDAWTLGTIRDWLLQ